jgi:lysozyme family protein
MAARPVDDIITEILRKEGSAYTDNPADSGGPTRYGITLATLARHRGRATTAAEVMRLTEAEAREIYRIRYVLEPGYAPVLALSPPIGAELVDTAVNAGPGRATEFLQRALNALNRQGKDYADITVDGQCGPGTAAALRAFLARRGTEGETVMLRALNCLQGEFYISLAERRPKDETFLYGWLKERVA